MDPGYYKGIPDEIIENILLAVPTNLLPFNQSWVCKKWTNIILQPQFWVHKLKRLGIAIDGDIWTVLQDFENNKIVSCLYYASLYQEHHTHTPISRLVSSSDTHWDDTDFPIISDDFVSMIIASGVLVCRSHWIASLHLKNEKIKALPLLLKLLEARKVPLCVRDEYAFWNFSPRVNYLQILKGDNIEAKNLLMFRGCLLTLEGVPLCSFPFIHLSIAVDEQNVAIDPGLSKIGQNTEITLHLKAGTNISNLPNITNNEHVLIVSFLEQSHILWMTEVAKKFLNDVIILIFFNYQLDLTSSEILLKSIAKECFDQDLNLDIFCSFPMLSSDSKYTILEDLVSTLWPNDNVTLHSYDDDDSLIYELDTYFDVSLGDYNYMDYMDEQVAHYRGIFISPLFSPLPSPSSSSFSSHMAVQL